MNYVCSRRCVHCDSSKLGATFCDPAAMSIKKMAALKSHGIILRKRASRQKDQINPFASNGFDLLDTSTIDGCYQ